MKLAERSVRVVMGHYVLQPEDHVVWGDATRGDVTITLPPPALAYDAATRIGRTFTIGKCRGKHAVSIPEADAPVGARVTDIDTGVVVISDGTAWWAIARV